MQADFCKLNGELKALHEEALEKCGARLPARFRWPSTKRAEGEERLPILDAYLKDLFESEEMAASKALGSFLELPPLDRED